LFFFIFIRSTFCVEAERLGLRSKSRSDRLLQLTRFVGGANLDHKNIAFNKRTAEG